MQTQSSGKKKEETGEVKTLNADFDYAPSIEATDIVTIKPKNKLFIGGKFVDSTAPKYFDSDSKHRP